MLPLENKGNFLYMLSVKRIESDAVFVFLFACFLQMVVVSDDVHEYAVALKDTDEKIARCPSRVRPPY